MDLFEYLETKMTDGVPEGTAGYLTQARALIHKNRPVSAGADRSGMTLRFQNGDSCTLAPHLEFDDMEAPASNLGAAEVPRLPQARAFNVFTPDAPR